ncbi:MAG: phosphopantetheinyl transferase-like protein [Nonomuraea sp.]|nr:phosphopantetheinyl transferase-like protein [Nonomuraea sp.]
MGSGPGEIRAPEEWLTDVERERADRFRFPADRESFVAAHLLVRLCAAELLGTHPGKLTLLQVCDVHGPGHGRPYLQDAEGVDVSFSHTRGYVCAVAGPGRVGADAERVPPGPLQEVLAERVLAPGESAATNDELIRHWTRKEALIKRGELTLDRLAEPVALDGRHLLEWAEGDIRVAVITDHPATRAPVPRVSWYGGARASGPGTPG